MSRMTFWPDHASTIWAARPGPMPSTSRSRSRLGVDHVEHAVAERLHELAREHRPDAPDEAGPEIPLDALEAARRRGVNGRGAELQAVDEVVEPLAHRADLLAGGDGRHVPDHRLEVAAAGHLEPEHAEAACPGLWKVTRSTVPATVAGPDPCASGGTALRR